MKKQLRKGWDALQPALRKPRWWVAGILRGITETIAFCKPGKTRYAVFEVGFGELGSIRRAVRLIRPGGFKSV